jgi:N-acetylneuraminic acid mutarotase
MFSNKICREYNLGITIGFLIIALFIVQGASASMPGANTNDHSENNVKAADRYNVDQGSPTVNWTTKASMPTSRSDLYRGRMAIGDKIYVAGGWKNGSLDLVEVYDVGKNKWNTVAPLPSPGINGAIQAVNGKLYIIGGNKNAGGDVDVWEYDPVKNNYSKKASFSGENDPATAVVDGKIYAFSNPAVSAGSPLGIGEMYDPITDTWTPKAPHPSPRQYLTAEAVNGKIYTFGGNKNDNLTHEYDPITDNWTEKSSMPVMIDSPNSVVVNGKIFVVGGDNSKTVWMYDPLVDIWQGPLDYEIPTPRALAATAEVNGRIYVIGGCCPMENYNVNEEGTINFTIVNNTPSLNATREIEKESLRLGESTNITIRINSNVIQALALQESIPAGWNFTKISDDADEFNKNSNEWIWLNVTPGITRTVIYSITAPVGASIGKYYINGTISNSSGVIGIVGENNMITLDIFEYYRRLGSNPDILETSDLLKAIDDWGSGTAPFGFARPLTYNELNALINEWATK